jgi:hypothetical protein
MPVDFLTHQTLNLYIKIHQKMTQCSIVAHLSLKGMSAREIHDDNVATLGPDAVSYSSVTRYICEGRFPLSKPEVWLSDFECWVNWPEWVIKHERKYHIQ